MTQILDLGRIRFQFKGTWSASTEYQFNDVVSYNGNAYCYISTAKTIGTLTNNTSFWGLMAEGFSFQNLYDNSTVYSRGSVVRYLNNLYYKTSNTIIAGVPPTVTADWTPLMLQDTASDKVFYVAPHGTDTEGSGTSMAQPFASIKYATQQCGTNATIFVKTGTYTEQCPIIVPNNVAIVGDNQRTVIVQPTPTTATGSMFLMSNGSILNKMTFTGMTGWTPGTTSNDITTSTIAGVVVRLNPDSPITHKSPYVLECSAIGNGLIGALIDGSVHATGAKTMIFHGYTIISDNGVGYWVKDGGKAEIVSCFTYYCYFGYTASGGGFIRSLNGNNSYGTWGATSRGFDASEIPVTCTLVGRQLNFLYQGGNINVGDTVTSSSGGTAIVTNSQISANKVYVTTTSGTFTVGSDLTFSSGAIGTVTTGGLEDQNGFILVVTGLSSQPKPGASITLAGDPISYVIQSVSGTYVNSSSTLILVLAQEKVTGSPPSTIGTIRYKYSQVRLTGHDFLSIGTGGVVGTNYPGEPLQPPAQGNETDEVFPGRVFYVSTDQDGNFRVGEYFRIDQATGRATLNASAFDLAGLTSLKLGSIGAQLGETINEFSSDATLSGNSNEAVPTEYAVKEYVDTSLSQVKSLVLVPTVDNTKALTAGSMTFSMGTLTITGESVYTIQNGAYHFVLNPDGFALFN
jgi:hypothetical protein